MTTDEMRKLHAQYRHSVEQARDESLSEETRAKAGADLVDLRHKLDDALIRSEEERESDALAAAIEARSAAAKLQSMVAKPEPSTWLDRSKLEDYIAKRSSTITFDVPRELRTTTDMTTADTTGYIKYTIPTDLHAGIDMFEIAQSAVLQAGPQTINTAQGNPLDWPTLTTDMVATLGAEGTTATDSAYPVLSKVTMSSYRIEGWVPLSDELLRDSGVALEGVLAQLAGRALAAKKAAYLAASATGTGSSCPHAITVHATSALTAASQTDVTMDELKQLFYSVLPAYRQNGSWLACSSLTLKIAQKKDDEGVYMWQPSNTAGEPDMLFGRAFREDAYMPAAASTTKSIGFGDVGAAFLVRNVGGREISFSRDFAFSSFETTMRFAEWFDSQTVDAIAWKYITQAS